MASHIGWRSRLKILLTNHQLSERAGSELATCEIAEVLKERGHAVAVFTLFTGPLAVEFEARTGIKVFSGIGDPLVRTGLAEFDPDVVHAHHWPTLIALVHLGVSRPVVMGFLGGLPPLENPPPLTSGQSIVWWSISERIRDRVLAVPGWEASPHSVIENWFDDREPRQVAINDGVRAERLLVVSNHFPDQLREQLGEVSRELGLAVNYVGLPANSQIVDRALLGEYDAVITLGRTAIAALAIGTPVLIADHYGVDGWITTDSLEALAYRSFSGRAFAIEPSTDLLRSLLVAPPSVEDIEALQSWVWENRRLTNAVDQLESLYVSALGAPVADPFALWSGTIIQYVSGLEAAASEHQRLEANVEALEARVTMVESRLERVRRSRDRAQAGLTQSPRGPIRMVTSQSVTRRLTSSMRKVRRGFGRV